MARLEPRYKISHLAALADQSRTTIERRIGEGLIRTVELLDGSLRIPEGEVLRYLRIDPEPGDENGAGE
jgi:predicted site-specific integrase-resolvase